MCAVRGVITRDNKYGVEFPLQEGFWSTALCESDCFQVVILRLFKGARVDSVNGLDDTNARRIYHAGKD